MVMNYVFYFVLEVVLDVLYVLFYVMFVVIYEVDVGFFSLEGGKWNLERLCYYFMVI